MFEAKDYKVSIGISERTKEPVEPLVMTQWWCNMQEPARKVLKSLEKGEMKLVPERHLKVNRDWLENIREWAIGRQLWWGHQLPAWYDEDGKIYVPDLENPELEIPMFLILGSRVRCGHFRLWAGPTKPQISKSFTRTMYW
jgi:valyl-tRNA synthetase